MRPADTQPTALEALVPLPDEGWHSLYPVGDVRAAPTLAYSRQVQTMAFLQQSWQSASGAACAWSRSAMALLPGGGGAAADATPPAVAPGPASQRIPSGILTMARFRCQSRVQYLTAHLPCRQKMRDLDRLLGDLGGPTSTLTFEMFCVLQVIAANQGICGDVWQKTSADLQGCWRRLMLQLHPDKLAPELERLVSAQALTLDQATALEETARLMLSIFDRVLHHVLPDPRLREMARAHRCRYPHLTCQDMRAVLRLKETFDDLRPRLEAAGRACIGTYESAVTGALCTVHVARAIWLVSGPMRADMASAALVGLAVGTRRAVRVSRRAVHRLRDAW